MSIQHKRYREQDLEDLRSQKAPKTRVESILHDIHVLSEQINSTKKESKKTKHSNIPIHPIVQGMIQHAIQISPNLPPSSSLPTTLRTNYQIALEEIQSIKLEIISSIQWKQTSYYVFTHGVLSDTFLHNKDKPYYTIYYYSIIYNTIDNIQIRKRIQGYDSLDALLEDKKQGHLQEDLHYVHDVVINQLYKDLYQTIMFSIEK